MIFCSTENECELYSTEKHKLESGTEISQHVHIHTCIVVTLMLWESQFIKTVSKNVYIFEIHKWISVSRDVHS